MDYNKLGKWRNAIKGKGSCLKYESVINYLNFNLLGWHFDLDDRAMEDCVLLVKRAETRQQNGENLIPRTLDKKRVTNPILEQEYKDAIKLNHHVTFIHSDIKKISELGNNYDLLLLGFAHTNVGGKDPNPIINDVKKPVGIILNKEYDVLDKKLNWIKNIHIILF